MSQNPRIIYKYYGNIDYAINTLKHRKIYCTIASEFNDPFDSQVEVNCDNIRPEDRKKILVHFLKKEKTTIKHSNEFKMRLESLINNPQSQLNTQLKEGIQSYFNSTTKNIFKDHRLSCFTSERDNILMWSHYGGGHRGACIWFNGDSDNFKTIQEIKYNDKFPELNYAKIICDEIHDSFVEFVTTKSRVWEYEKEWRIIHNNEYLELNSDCITGLTLGCCITQNDKEKILSVVNSMSDEIDVYQAKKSKTKFEIELEKIL